MSERAKQEFNDLDFIDAREEWPLWPLLPVKRKQQAVKSSGFGSWPQMGVIVDAEGHRHTVWLTLLGMPIDPETTDKIVYDDAQAIVNDGWMVD